jgi:hypothetical protein
MFGQARRRSIIPQRARGFTLEAIVHDKALSASATTISGDEVVLRFVQIGAR